MISASVRRRRRTQAEPPITVLYVDGRQPTNTPCRSLGHLVRPWACVGDDDRQTSDASEKKHSQERLDKEQPASASLVGLSWLVRHRRRGGRIGGRPEGHRKVVS